MKTLVFDTETTGLPDRNWNYEIDFDKFPRIITLAWKIDDKPARGVVINQEGFHIPEESTEIHGITDEIAAKSEITIGEALEMMIEDGKGNDLAVAHNIYFDTSTIKANALRIGRPDLFKKLTEILHKDKRIDTMRSTITFCNLPGKYGKQKKWPKLSELYDKLFPGEEFNAHNSKDDVEATNRSFLRLTELGVINLEEKLERSKMRETGL